MNTVEIINLNKTESELDQPTAGNSKTPLYKEISVISSIYHWNPTGIRVVIKLPLLADDRSAIFAIRNTPFIPHLGNDSCFGEMMASRLSTNLAFVCHPSNYALGMGDDGYADDLALQQFETDPAVSIVTHSAPPLLSELARANRYHSGGIDIRLRNKASVSHNGVTLVTSIYGQKPYFSYASPTNCKTLIPTRDSFSLLDKQANSYVYSDLTLNRHIEVSCPYQKPYPYEDQFAKFSLIASARFMTGPTQVGFKAYPPNAWVENYTAFAIRGNISNTSGSDNEISFEIDYKASSDFEFAGEHLYFNPVSDHDQAIHGTTIGAFRYGTTVPVNSNILPRRYRNPQFTADNKPQFAPSVGNERLLVVNSPYVVE